MNTKYNPLIIALMTSICLFEKGEANSAKALGMGNATVAYPQDSLCVAYNPALGVAVGNRTDFWVSSQFAPYDLTIDQSELKRANIHASGRRTWTLGTAFGSMNQVCSHLSMGFVGYERFFNKTHYNHPSVLMGSTKLGRAYAQYCFSGVAAVRYQSHELGLSLDFLAGQHKVSGLENFDDKDHTIAPGRVTNRGYDWNYGVGLTLGWLWNITPEFKIGASFRPETKMSRFRKYKGFIPEHGVFHNPQRAMAGFSWRVLPCMTVSFDAEYIWIRGIRADKNSLRPQLKNKLGSKHGTALGLKNDLSLHTGMDYALTNAIIVRAGYIYQREVQKKSQAFWDTLYCYPLQHFMTFGATYTWNQQVEIDLFYIHGFERSIKGPHAIPKFLGGGDVKMRRSLDKMGIGVSVVF